MASQGIKFLYEFSVGEYAFANPGSNVISVTSQAAGDHDKKNLTTAPLRETFRTSAINTWQEIIIEANDLTVVPNMFAILNHNLTEAAVVQIQGATNSSFAAPAFTLTIPWAEKHMILDQDIGQAYQYYRLRILDPANPCGYLEIGRVIGGKAFTMTNNEDIADDLSIMTMDKAYRMETEGFHRAFNERVKVDQLNIRFDRLWTTSTATEPTRADNYKNLMKMFKTVGETYPFLTVLDPEDPNFAIMWAHIDRLPNRAYGINRYVSLNFALQEVY